MHATTENVRTGTPLSRLQPAKEGRVVSLSGGSSFRSKMYQLGIHESAPIHVVANRRSGPLVIEAGGTRLIIGRGMAEKILVHQV